MLCYVAILLPRTYCYFDPILTLHVLLRDHDFSCYVIVARHLPDMLCPCHQTFTSHVTSCEVNVWSDFLPISFDSLNDRQSKIRLHAVNDTTTAKTIKSFSSYLILTTFTILVKLLLVTIFILQLTCLKK